LYALEDGTVREAMAGVAEPLVDGRQGADATRRYPGLGKGVVRRWKKSSNDWQKD
jgi:hypothetical protein